MKKILLKAPCNWLPVFVLICLFSSSCIYAQRAINLKFYKTTEDYNNDRLDSADVLISFGTVHKEYLQISRVIDPETGKKNKEVPKYWMVLYAGRHYINTLYSVDLQGHKLFIKFEPQKGKYQTLTLDKESKLFKYEATNTSAVAAGGVVGGFVGGALAGFAGALLDDPQKVFRDENDNKKFILIIDVTNIRAKTKKLGANSRINFLTKEKLVKSLLKGEVGKNEVRKWVYEDVMKHIEDKNLDYEKSLIESE